MTKVLEGRTRKYAMLGKPSGSNVSGRKKKAMSDSLVSNKMRWPPRWLSDKESTSQCRRCRRHGFDPWVRKTPQEGSGNPLEYSCLENPMDRVAWWATVHRLQRGSMTERLSKILINDN